MLPIFAQVPLTVKKFPKAKLYDDYRKMLDKQKNIDANKDGRISAEDFAIMRSRQRGGMKKKMMGGGMMKKKMMYGGMASKKKK